MLHFFAFGKFRGFSGSSGPLLYLTLFSNYISENGNLSEVVTMSLVPGRYF